MRAGGHAFLHGEDVGAALEVPRDYFRPDASDYGCRQVTRFVQFTRTDQTTGRYPLESDIFAAMPERGW